MKTKIAILVTRIKEDFKAYALLPNELFLSHTGCVAQASFAFMISCLSLLSVGILGVQHSAGALRTYF